MRFAVVVLTCLMLAACGGGSPTAPTPPDTSPVFVQTGSGNSVFDMPTSVDRVRIQALWSGNGTSNFIVRIGNTLTVNAILRDLPGGVYDGTHLTNGGVVQITNADNITSWTFTEVR